MSTVILYREEKKILAPKLRFQEFNDAWTKIKLGDLLTFKNGLNSDREKYGKGIKFINVLDILNNNFITYDKILGSVEVTEKEFEKNEVSYGDILFQRSSETRDEVGQANVYLDRNKSSVFGGFVIRGKAKYEYNPLFMNYLLRTPIARKEITDKSGGSTRYNVGQDTLSQVQLTTTAISEQQKIAFFLSAVDEKIQQLSRKKELLEQYKKGVMQQLFSGKLRFKNENGEDYPDWEEKKLGELVKIKSGNSPSDYQFIDNGFYPFIKVEELNNCNKYQKNSRLYSNDDKNLIESKSVIFPKRGAAILNNKIRINDCSILMDSNMMALIPLRKELDVEFLYFKIVKEELYKIADTSSIPQINNKHIEPYIISTPCLEEQQKIANFLSSIDDKIERTSQQISQTKTFKKGLLQQMFV